MSLAIVASFPVESNFVPSCLEYIIDKKVAGIALNLLEELVDCICSWFYCPYNMLYQEKIARVHLFSDQITHLYDCTKKAVASIEHDWANDFITLHKTKVYFNLNPNIDVIFSKQTFTDYVVVCDDERRRAGWYRIIEQGLPQKANLKPMEKSWQVNTNQLHQFAGRVKVTEASPVYLAQ